MNDDRSIASRRAFLVGASGVSLSACATTTDARRTAGSGALALAAPLAPDAAFMALDKVSLRISGRGTLTVTDAARRRYVTQAVDGARTPVASFRVGGALGTHVASLADDAGNVVAELAFPVTAQTRVADGGRYERLFAILERTMLAEGGAMPVFIDGRTYRIFSTWFQDHMYIQKGLRYFEPDVKSGIDLYASVQREDGMIHDNCSFPYANAAAQLARFGYGGFVAVPKDPRSDRVFVRIPVENIGEFTFIEAVHRSWRETGDDAWMASRLDGCLKAVAYATSDPYRWSKQRRLLKRGYTVDLWDFQAQEDARAGGGDTMSVRLDRTRFSIMYGDNVRMAASCGYLAEMLAHVGRAADADGVRRLGADLRARIDELSWNGSFYRHHVPEEPGIKRDFGVDEATQVTLSNTWAMGAGISHDKCVAIIKTYQRIRAEMPESSPGEWYACYPPFERGFGIKWQYMNGGVTGIVAGELARGAFEHGFEAYGADILTRLHALSDATGVLEGGWRGARPTEPARTFATIDLRGVANADLAGGTAGVPGFAGEPGNDLASFPTGRRSYEGIPFDVVDPASNARKACLGLSAAKGYQREVTVDVGRRAGAIYLLHVNVGAHVAGRLRLSYADGSEVTKPISRGEKGNKYGGDRAEVGPFWSPAVNLSGRAMPFLKVAWRGDNAKFKDVGVYVFGFSNPHPDKEIKSLVFEASGDDGKWMVLGVTLSDAPLWMMLPEHTTFPEKWAAAECLFALVEGMAGIESTGRAFSDARVALRWSAADVRAVKATARLASSNGYAGYEYEAVGDEVRVRVTASGDRLALELLLPAQRRVAAAWLDGQPVEPRIRTVEASRYATIDVAVRGVHDVRFKLV